jgi:eukaryotic-like serine/threonine-protein kinase
MLEPAELRPAGQQSRPRADTAGSDGSPEMAPVAPHGMGETVVAPAGRPSAAATSSSPQGPPVLAGAPGAGASSAAAADALGSIGPFRILGTLGQGGMGVVYRAEQIEPVRREVALKLIHARFTTPAATLRFAAERQAMARLAHPCIARIFEAGTTSEGFPYFAMELVPGQPLTAYADERRLPLEARVRLLIEVCRGVEHAHRRGILHRDLKPANILVAETEGQPAPKIIDFGVAKAIDQPLTEQTLATGEMMVGTPAYMSPEAFQAGEQGADLDTRTDVYALGVMLYELLAGLKPFELRGLSLTQIAYKALTEDVPRPSARLAAQDGPARARLAELRRELPASLARRLAGELDWIAVRATARERAERYGSAAELAEDLTRFLRQEPVLACPPSVRYRVGKLVRRHRMAVTAGALLAAALVLGIAGTSMGMLRAQRAEARALAMAERADREALAAQHVSQFLAGLFERSDPFGTEDPAAARGAQITVQELLARGVQRLETGLIDDHEIRAQLLNRLGLVYLGLGLHDEAERLLREGLELRRQLFGAADAQVAESEHALGWLLLSRGDAPGAEPLLRQALETRRRVLGSRHPDVARTLA